MQGAALLRDVLLGAAQAARQFRVVQGAKQLVFPRGPAAGWKAQADALAFAHGDDFLDGAAGAAGEDGIRRFAEPLQFGQRPWRAPASFDSLFHQGRHGLTQEPTAPAANDQFLNWL